MSGSHLRMAMLGGVDVGKGSLGNTIMGQSVFKTYTCSKDWIVTMTREVHGRTITLSDTPSFYQSHYDRAKPEILKCLTHCSPGPHAFLIVVKVDIFTDVDEIISKIKGYFSVEAFKYAILVFTHGDQLPDGMKIEEFVGKDEKLRHLLEKCGGRCHVVDNNYWNNNQEDEYRSNKVQVEALLNTIDRMIEENGGRYYTNEMLQEVERKTQAESKHNRQETSKYFEEY